MENESVDSYCDFTSKFHSKSCPVLPLRCQHTIPPSWGAGLLQKKQMESCSPWLVSGSKNAEPRRAQAQGRDHQKAGEPRRASDSAVTARETEPSQQHSCSWMWAQVTGQTYSAVLEEQGEGPSGQRARHPKPTRLKISSASSSN